LAPNASGPGGGLTGTEGERLSAVAVMLDPGVLNSKVMSIVPVHRCVGALAYISAINRRNLDRWCTGVQKGMRCLY
jgi:hypothetical protein